MIRRVVIIRASGDLIAGYLLPAFAQLHATGDLPKDLEILAVACETGDTEGFRIACLSK